MGLERFDKLFGGTRGSAQQTLNAMKKTYGARQGQTMFDAQVIKRQRRAKISSSKGRRRR